MNVSEWMNDGNINFLFIYLFLEQNIGRKWAGFLKNRSFRSGLVDKTPKTRGKF